MFDQPRQKGRSKHSHYQHDPRWCLALSTLLITFPALSPAAICTWQGTTSDTWSTSANWSCTAPATSPSSTDNAVIDSSKTVDLDITTAVSQLTLANSGAILNGSGSISSTNDFDLQAGTINAILSGSSGLIKTTADTVTLSGANSFTGNTQVNAGGLALAANDVLANNSGLIVNGGTLAMGANNDTVDSVQLLDGSITGTTGTLTSLNDFDLRKGTVSAQLGGSVNLIKTTADTVTLSGANSFTGNTQVNAGGLALAANDVLANNSGLIVNGGTLAMGANNDTVSAVQLTSGSITGSGTLTSNSAFDLRAGSISTILAGNVGLNKTTSGTVILSGDNTYTGATHIDEGILNFTGSRVHTGSFTGNGTLQFGGGVHTFNPGSNISTQHLIFSDGINTVNQGAQLSSSTIEFSGGANTLENNVSLSPDALLFSGGSNLVKTGAGLAATTAVFSGGTTDILGDYIVSASTTVDGGTVNFSAQRLNLGSTFTINDGVVNLQRVSTQVDQYIQTGGILSGPGDLTVKSAVLSGGQMLGPGRLIIEGTGGGGTASDLLLSGDFILNNQSTVLNSGNVRVTQNAAFIGSGSYRQTSGTTQVDGIWNQALTEIQSGSFGGNGTVGGPLINDGTVGIAASNLHLNGPLSGTGSYAGAVTIHNSFSPGPGPDGLGIATINAPTADLILSPTSNLNLEFGGNLNGQLVSDSISAGNIDIQGAQLNLLRLTDQPNFTPSQAFAQVTLLQTSGSITGNFNENVSCPEGSSDLFVLSKQQQQFLLTVVPKLPSLVPADVQSLANALQQIDCSPSTPASLQNLVNGLKPFLENGTADTNKVDQFISALRQISPGQIAVEQNVSSQITKLQTANVGQRLTSVRAMSAGGSAPSSINVSSSVSAPVTASPPPAPTTSSPTSTAPSTPSRDSSSPATAPSSASFAFSTDGDGGNPELGPGFSNLGLFINGQFEWAERSSTLIQRGYRSTLSAVTAGADYRLSQRLLVGLSAGYGSSEVTVSQKGGGQSVDGYTLSAYSSLNLTDNWYVDLVNNLTYNQYASKRVTLYTDAQNKVIEQTAQSQTDGWQNRTSISTGYDFSLSEWTLGVRGRTEYGYSFVNGRREQGADLGLNMIVGELNNESLTSSLGAMVSHALSTPIGVLVSQVNVEWEHQWFNKNSLITTRFVDAPNNPFTTDSFSIDKDYVNVRAGVSAQLPFGGSAFLQYDTTLGQQYITRHAFNVGVRIEF